MGHLERPGRRWIEDRIVEAWHRLVMDRACGGPCGIPGSREEAEEELLDEVANLERSIVVGEDGGSNAREGFKKDGR